MTGLMRFFLCALIFCALTSLSQGLEVKSLTADKFDALATEELMIRYEKPLSKAASDLVAAFPGIKTDLEKALPWTIDFRPTIVLLKDTNVFRSLAGNDTIIAYAVPGRKLIVIDYSKTENHPFRVDMITRHELCHLVLHHHIAQGVPKWLDEGVCQLASGGIIDIITGTKRSFLNQAVVSGMLLPISRLGESFPDDTAGLLLAYEESRSFVDYLANTHGREKLAAVLRALGDNIPLDQAISRNLGLSLPQLEDNWHRYLRKRLTWLAYLSDHIYEILFLAAALMTIYAFIRLMGKKRKRPDHDDNEADEFPPSKQI